ncbi:probable WRKY transcription factor 63 [Zea mays]|uniref:probable WRKY transcription factor 63 n=1 Tax=Zea mays TaxID=4577 RepID=UPI0004DE7D32|nr:probable WRKY transcription factor 63 [Zea mays]|eukprot:XP_008675625.1 probable WRKY transcription factor 63 [Zea mays]
MNILESSSHSSGCGRVVIDEIEHQRALMVDLHDLILPILDPCSRQAKHVQQLFQDISSSSSKVISFVLELADDNSKKQQASKVVKDRRKAGGKNVVESHMLLEEAKEIGKNRRKNAQHTGSVVTQAPHFDGYQWRKYRQKCISKAKHSRNYYRCANSKDQGCPATKTVQQKETDGSGAVKLFDVDYYGQHTCNKDGVIHPYVVDTAHDSVPTVDHNQSCSTPTSSAHNNGVHGILQDDESFENLFMVPSIPEHLTDESFENLVMVSSIPEYYLADFTDVEMAEGALEVASMMISEDIWA